MTCVYSIAAAADENDLVTDIAEVRDRSRQLKDESLVLSLLSQRNTGLLKQSQTIPKGFAPPFQAQARV